MSAGRGYGTTSPQMCTVLEGIRSLLFAYTLARDWSQFEIQERLLLRILACIESSGVAARLGGPPSRDL